jgi:hypothetical protein
MSPNISLTWAIKKAKMRKNEREFGVTGKGNIGFGG